MTDPTFIHFHYALEFNTQTLAGMLDSLVRVSRRVVETHSTSILSARYPEVMPLQAHCSPRSATRHPVKGYNTLQAEPRSKHPYTALQTDADPQNEGIHQAEARLSPRSVKRFHRFPTNGFTYCFIASAGYFSSFHYCTCSLSVSRPYLALDGIYHPIRAAFPNNSTLREQITMHTVVLGMYGIITLFDTAFQQTCPRSGADHASIDYNSDCEAARLQN